MYAREIDGREFSFGVSGKLIRNVLVMYDRETESLWSQLLGEAVSGEMQGTMLEFLPTWHTTWAEWREMHPETLALRKGFGGGRDPYTGYYASGATGVIGETHIDNRLTSKEFVIGVTLEDTAIAYPFRVLNGEPVVNDTVGGRDLLVLFDQENGGGIVFDRQVDGQTLSFAPAAEGQLVDSETGTLWDSFHGQALEGTLAGKKLDRIKSTIVFWFGWKDFYSDTLIYGVEEG
ncbi:MAG: DUF3179 domain-containing protein [Chloroflexota bacterium]|nr:MAG: DUF3179 domain-containing protein [Chloroflexota bacterium]